MNYFEESLKMHEKYTGKLEIRSKVKIETKEDLGLAYTDRKRDRKSVV